MEKAIGSRVNLQSLEDVLAVQFMDCISDIIYNDKIQRLNDHEQHCRTTRLQHSINVAYYSFLVCRFFGWDYRSAARAGLMHDLFHYDWRTTKIPRTNHATWHPRIALNNAKKISEINKIEENIILRHMWPCTLIPPRYKEAFVVNIADKLCAICETTGNKFVEVFG